MPTIRLAAKSSARSRFPGFVRVALASVAACVMPVHVLAVPPRPSDITAPEENSAADARQEQRQQKPRPPTRARVPDRWSRREDRTTQEGAALGEAPTVSAVAVDEGVTVDGTLNESAWNLAEPATGFTQREPRPGEPATENTEVRFLYTPTVLYVGVRALDAQPSLINADEMRRDAGLVGDDTITILLDTFRDRRNAFIFQTNPNGARRDGLITDEGRDRNFDWDGVWDVAARRTEEGWTAELAIPFSTLRFSSGTDAWGLNIQRIIRHKNEETYWSPVDLDAEIFRVSRAGTLAGLRGLRRGVDLRFKPYVLGGRSKSFDLDEIGQPSTRDDDFEFGADVRWGISDSLTLDLTYNTDFAQVEVDEQQVNLTRFSLFFPEKREFFLENAGIFEFGPGAGERGLDRPVMKAFFSRRIGLDGGDVVPILGGARLTGRVGGWSIGVLDVHTDDFVPTPDDEDDEDDGPIPDTNWGVVRIKRSLGERSNVGMIFTNRQASTNDYNRVFGIDTEINPSRRLKLNGFFVMSEDPDDGPGEETWAAGGGIRWESNTLRANVDFMDIREGFNPEAGYLQREGVRRYRGDFEFNLRVDSDFLRALSFGGRADIFTTTDGTLETVDAFVIPLRLRLQSDDMVNFFISRSYERLDEPFEIFDDIEVPVGEYDDYAYGVYFRSNPGRLVVLNVLARTGDFYDGTGTRGSVTIRLRPSGYFSAETSWSFSDVDMPWGAFATNVLRERLNFSLNPNLSVNAFAQYNDEADIFAVNARLNWIYRPGADLFLVYNQTWDTENSVFRTEDRALVLKFTYLFIL